LSASAISSLASPTQSKNVQSLSSSTTYKFGHHHVGLLAHAANSNEVEVVHCRQRATTSVSNFDLPCRRCSSTDTKRRDSTSTSTACW
jgi:hypothetical protein